MNKKFFIKTTSVFVLIAIIILLCTFSTVVLAEEDETIYYVGGNTDSTAYATTTDYVKYPQNARIVQTDSYFLKNKCPTYQNSNSALTNCCANVSGAILLGYYDKYYENLIPNISAFSSQMGIYLPYGLMINYVQPIINDLYNRMGTNTIKPGTSEKQFFDGLTSYCAEKQTSVYKHSVKSGDSLNILLLKMAFFSNKIVTVFSSKHNKMTQSGNTLSIVYSEIPHIFAVYGYEKYTVYSENNSVIDEYYVLLASKGLENTFDLVYLNSDYITVDSAYIIDIGE